MPNKKVNRTRKVNNTRKVNRTRKVVRTNKKVNRNRKVSGRSKKMVGGGGPKRKPPSRTTVGRKRGRQLINKGLLRHGAIRGNPFKPQRMTAVNSRAALERRIAAQRPSKRNPLNLSNRAQVSQLYKKSLRFSTSPLTSRIYT